MMRADAAHDVIVDFDLRVHQLNFAALVDGAPRHREIIVKVRSVSAEETARLIFAFAMRIPSPR